MRRVPAAKLFMKNFFSSIAFKTQGLSMFIKVLLQTRPRASENLWLFKNTENVKVLDLIGYTIGTQPIGLDKWEIQG